MAHSRNSIKVCSVPAATITKTLQASIVKQLQLIETKMIHLTVAILRYSLFVGLLLRPAAPQPLDKASLQGLLLGLPTDGQQGSSGQQEAPAFVKDTYKCWSSSQAGNCLPGYHGSDVNLLRTSLGTGMML